MPIERVDFPLSLEDFYFRFHTRRRPVVIRTSSLAQLGWQTHLWSNEYLAYKAGAHEVLVQKRGSGEYSAEGSAYVPMRFADFLQRVMARAGGDAGMYLNLQTNNVLEPPLLQLLGDFSIPPYFKDLTLRCVNLWMGNSDKTIVTPLHHDFNDNLYVVVEGTKRFTLFPPEQAPNLYPRGQLQAVEPNGIIRYATLSGMPHLSQVDIHAPDRQRFPRYAEAEPTREDVDIRAGELLFLPAGWFHQVSSTGRHVAVSFFSVVPGGEELQRMQELLARRRGATA
ncbi:MAG TPA: cupin-like domain-containing protein [Gammaproteobacteria bacterium]|jgi:mannose-6-phosphate isomerase-like protein (cupin superfamily)|nr:cupin-like domain-containing protein [Gammaproteobacteria bacterium]